MSSVGIEAAHRFTFREQVKQLISDLGVTDYLWWPLDDASTSLADLSGNAHTGTASGSTVTTGVASGLLDGDPGKVMSFTGTTPVGQVAYGAWADNTKFTIISLFKVASAAAARVLNARDHQSGGRRYQSQLDATGKLVFTTFDTTASAHSITSPLAYDDNAWHLASKTYDQSLASGSRKKIYVDNSSAAVVTGGPVNGLATAGVGVPFSAGNATRTTQAPLLGAEGHVIFIPGFAITGAQHQELDKAAFAL